MGLHINAINGLRSASGYELYVLTFGLSKGGPECRAIQENFSYLADILGARGMVITGDYDADYRNNFSGFMSEIHDKIFSTSIAIRDDLGVPSEIPIPGLIVMRKKIDAELDVAYFSIRNMDYAEIFEIFRCVSEMDDSSKLRDIPGNIFHRRRKGLAKSLWDSVQIRPNFFGVGLDVKELLEKMSSK